MAQDARKLAQALLHAERAEDLLNKIDLRTFNGKSNAAVRSEIVGARASVGVTIALLREKMH